LPFFANGYALYRRYAEFLIESRKPDYALQLLDVGRAKNDGRRPEPGEGETQIRSQNIQVDVQADCPQVRCVDPLLLIGPKIPGVGN